MKIHAIRIFLIAFFLLSGTVQSSIEELPQSLNLLKSKLIELSRVLEQKLAVAGRPAGLEGYVERWKKQQVETAEEEAAWAEYEKPKPKKLIIVEETKKEEPAPKEPAKPKPSRDVQKKLDTIEDAFIEIFKDLRKRSATKFVINANFENNQNTQKLIESLTDQETLKLIENLGGDAAVRGMISTINEKFLPKVGPTEFPILRNFVKKLEAALPASIEKERES